MPSHDVYNSREQEHRLLSRHKLLEVHQPFPFGLNEPAAVLNEPVYAGADAALFDPPCVAFLRVHVLWLVFLDLGEHPGDVGIGKGDLVCERQEVRVSEGRFVALGKTRRQMPGVAAGPGVGMGDPARLRTTVHSAPLAAANRRVLARLPGAGFRTACCMGLVILHGISSTSVSLQGVRERPIAAATARSCPEPLGPDESEHGLSLV